MSARRRTIHFAAEAEEDIQDILVFTAQRWGSRQRSMYQSELDAAFTMIRENPGIGRLREELGEGVRGFLVRQHMILYTVDAGAITVVRVVHVRKDFGSIRKS